MTLTRRLLVGMSPLLLVFLGVGIYAIYLFVHLGGAIEVILKENYASVVASQRMREAAEGMDNSLLFALNGDEQKGRDLFAASKANFEKQSDIESANITLPGEGNLEAEIRQLHAKYLSLSNRFFASAVTKSARRSLYFDQLLPISDSIKQRAGEDLGTQSGEHGCGQPSCSGREFVLLTDDDCRIGCRSSNRRHHCTYSCAIHR